LKIFGIYEKQENKNDRRRVKKVPVNYSISIVCSTEGTEIGGEKTAIEYLARWDTVLK
jgi:hypothetical protein